MTDISVYAQLSHTDITPANLAELEPKTALQYVARNVHQTQQQVKFVATGAQQRLESLLSSRKDLLQLPGMSKLQSTLKRTAHESQILYTSIQNLCRAVDVDLSGTQLHGTYESTSTAMLNEHNAKWAPGKFNKEEYRKEAKEERKHVRRKKAEMERLRAEGLVPPKRQKVAHDADSMDRRESVGAGSDTPSNQLSKKARKRARKSLKKGESVEATGVSDSQAETRVTAPSHARNASIPSQDSVDKQNGSESAAESLIRASQAGTDAIPVTMTTAEDEVRGTTVVGEMNEAGATPIVKHSSKRSPPVQNVTPKKGATVSPKKAPTPVRDPHSPALVESSQPESDRIHSGLNLSANQSPGPGSSASRSDQPGSKVNHELTVPESQQASQGQGQEDETKELAEATPPPSDAADGILPPQSSHSERDSPAKKSPRKRTTRQETAKMSVRKQAVRDAPQDKLQRAKERALQSRKAKRRSSQTVATDPASPTPGISASQASELVSPPIIMGPLATQGSPTPASRLSVQASPKKKRQP